MLSHDVCFPRNPTVHPAFVDFDYLREASISDYINDVLVRGPRYKDIIADHLRLAIGVEYSRVLILQQAVAS